MKSRRLAGLLILVCLLAVAVHAKKTPVYKYRLADGTERIGTEVPDGAVIIEQVGEVETDAPNLSLPDADLSDSRFKLPDFGRVAEELLSRPATSLLVLAATFFWAIGVANAIPAIFSTRLLSLNDSLKYVMNIIVYCALLFAIGLGLDWLWLKIQWQPADDFGQLSVDIVGWTLYAGVVALTTMLRLGVGLAQALLLGGLWLLLVLAMGCSLWFWGVPLLQSVL